MYCLLIRAMSSLEWANVVLVTAIKAFKRVLSFVHFFACCFNILLLAKVTICEFDVVFCCISMLFRKMGCVVKTKCHGASWASCILECTNSAFFKRKPLFHEVDTLLQVQGCCFRFWCLSENYCCQRVKLSVFQDGGRWLCSAWKGWNIVIQLFYNLFFVVSVMWRESRLFWC